VTRLRPPVPVAAAALGVVLVLALSACGSSTTKNSTAGTQAPSATTATTAGASSATTAPSQSAALATVGAAKATGKTLSLARSGAGIFLIGPDGHSLYVFDGDQGTTSACTSAVCSAAWPALTSSGTPTTGPGVDASKVGTAQGQVAGQVTYGGHLLYYFAADSAPGQTNGATIPHWHLIGPFANVMGA
jgi:predicted lipoprotein with Yx(FWY)xxD motif